MAYQEVLSLNTDNVISLGGINTTTGKKNPTKIEGYYLGRKQNRPKNPTDSPSAIHVFQTENGNVGVWEKSDLRTNLPNVPRGAMTLVEFKEVRKLDGGRKKYVYRIAFDPDRKIDAGSLPDDEIESSTLESAGSKEEEDFGDTDTVSF